MTKENVEKLATPYTHLDVSEVSADEKKVLQGALAVKGFTSSTFYLRFFQKGFAGWEIIGVKECKRRFLELPEVSAVLLTAVPEDDPKALPGDRGYLYLLSRSGNKGTFYECLKQARKGLCLKFFEFMKDLGMSQATVVKRFTEDVWKPWEEEGIVDVLQPFIDK